MDIQKSICFDKFQLSFNHKTVSFLVDRDSNPWFKAKEVAQTLEYVRPRNAISRFVKDRCKTSYKELVSNIEPKMVVNKARHPHTTYINEFGLGQLTAKSNMRLADHFKEWILEEVIPSIRKYSRNHYEKVIESLRRELVEVRESSKRARQSLMREIVELREISIEEATELKQYADYIKTYAVHKNIKESKLHSFIVLKIDFGGRDKYYAIRTQTMNVERTIKKIQERYPGAITLLRYYFIPNAINFYTLMKEQLKDTVKFDGNLFSIRFNRISEAELLKAIDQLFHEKKF